MIDKFWEHIYLARQTILKVRDIIDSWYAWKAFFFLMLSATLYQVLIVYDNLNYSFFVFQILIMVQAVTYLSQCCIMLYNQIPGWLIYLLIGLALVIPAVSPFTAYYQFLSVGKWPFWVYFYFVVGYPLAYLFLGIYAFINHDVYYNKILAHVIGILMFVFGAITLFYGYIYGAYMHYCNIPFLTREVITSIVYTVQSSKVAGVERVFQLMMLFNAASISNYNFGFKMGKYI